MQFPEKTALVRNFVRTVVLLLLVGAWLGTALPALAVPATGGFADDPNLTLVSSGAGWQYLEQGDFPGGAAVADPANDRFVVFAANVVDQVEAAGLLPASEAQEIRDELAAEGLSYLQVEDTFVVHLEAAEDKANGGGGGGGGGGGTTAFGVGHSSTKDGRADEKDCWGWQAPTTKSDSWNWNHPGTFNLVDIDNSYFEGTLDAKLPVNAQVDASVQYKVKKAFCAPYKFRLIQAVVAGHAEIDQGGITADAKLKYTNDWKWKKNLYTANLGGFTVQLGPIPVYLKFTLPLDFGIDTKVDIQGEAHLKAEIDARAEFNVTCTASSCNGTSSLTRTFDIADPELALQLEAEARIWAKASVKMEVYDDSLGYASVGAEGYVKGHLFGYYGNMCGDGDGNGTNEYVSALLLDIDAGYEIDAKLGGLLLPDRDWTLLGDSYHLAWWDLLGNGGSSVLTPMISGPDNPDAGASATYTFETRPCWPYTDTVTLSWNGPVNGSGTVTPPNGSLSDTEIVPAGTHVQRAYPVSDSHGRTFGSIYDSEMDVYAGVLPPTVASDYDYFGRALAGGDFDCDGKDDLAVGIPWEDMDEKLSTGMVTVVLSSPEAEGLAPIQASQTLELYNRSPSQLSIANARFGTSLAVGDFDNDGCDDLAVGAPGDYGNEGITHVFYGHADRQLTLGTRSYLYLDTSAIPGDGFALDYFGENLATGDVDGDGYDDLAVTIPGFDAKAGAVAMLYGQSTGIGTSPKNALVYQDSPGVPDTNEDNDGTSMNVAIGDFDADGHGDLVIGYPNEDYNTNLNNDGYVVVVKGTASGLATTGNQGFAQNHLVGGGTSAEDSDRFGWSFAVHDVDGDGYDDLSIGSPYEDWGATVDAGIVQTVFGSPTGLETSSGVKYSIRSQWDVPEIERTYFGWALQAGDFDGDGFSDVASGAWGSSLFVDPYPGLITYAGQVFVGYGQATGAFEKQSGTGNTTGYIFSRITYGFEGPRHSYLYTGYVLGGGDFDGDGNADLAIGSHGSNIDGKTRAGSANVLYGDASHLSAIGSVHLHQD